MNLNVILCKRITNYNDPITIVGQFQIEDVDMEMTFNRFVDSYENDLKNISVFNDKFGFWYSPYDPRTNTVLTYLPFDDYHGKVEFNVNASEMTLEQLLYKTENETNTFYILQRSGGVGGGGDLIPGFMEFAEKLGTLFEGLNEFYGSYGLYVELIRFAAKFGYKKINKVYQEQLLKNNHPELLFKYIYSKNFWEMSKLKVSFDTDDEEVVQFIMKFSGFVYNEKEKIFCKSDEIVMFENYDVSIITINKIAIHYLRYIKPYNFSYKDSLDFIKNNIDEQIEDDILILILEKIREVDSTEGRELNKIVENLDI